MSEPWKWEPREGLKALVTLPEGERFTALKMVGKSLYAFSTCGTFKAVRGRMVLVANEPANDTPTKPAPAQPT